MHFRRSAALAALLFAGSLCFAPAQAKPKPHAANRVSAVVPATPAAPPADRDWWRNAVLYEIYPRSFQDTNGDGVGDLNGITRRLDYLKNLGVDAIWITPCSPSPQVDFGYDISDYKAIDPQYGSLADFDRLLAEARKRNIRVLMDMVMNHTSDQHPWFRQSRASRENPYRDWYIWRDPKGYDAAGNPIPPNNWLSGFGHSAWQWDAATQQFYYHRFYAQQPDLNWNNPHVREAFKEILGFWLRRGVAGFRFDAITTLFEDPTLADEPYLRDAAGQIRHNAYGDPMTDSSKTANLPGLHTVMQEMRAYTNKFGSGGFPGTRLLVGETYVHNIHELAKMYGTPARPEFQLPMDTQVGMINRLDVAIFRRRLIEAQTGLGSNLPLLLFDNHDNRRLDLRYGDGAHDTEIQRALAAVLLASRGAALLYYGDEIGMKTTPPTSREEVKDPIGLIGWPRQKGRDGERTPMQWDASANAGFSVAQPWLPVPASAEQINVRAEQTDPNSLLAWYKSLIQLKKTNPALARGTELMLDLDNTAVLSWLRRSPGQPTVVVAVNFTAESQRTNLSAAGPKGAQLHTLLASPGVADPSSAEEVVLPAFGVYLAELRCDFE